MAIRLIKPQDILDTEYAELEQKVKTDYLEAIEQAKAISIPEIAETQLQIKEAQKYVTEQTKRDNALAKEIERVQKELLGNDEALDVAANG